MKSMGLIASPQPAFQKPHFDSCDRNCKISAVNHSKEIPILLNFVNLSTVLCPGL